MKRAFSETPGDQWILDSGEPATVECPWCRGEGEKEEAEGMIECPACEGLGEMTEHEAQRLLDWTNTDNSTRE